ncbi:DUF1292 domain-containing protein [Massilibacterium senegalense]|uniref:DUF1292 domain-containing protein n=1 Tax=Massilibacterium senegalense TaxID=1632858 RepID=UPI0007857856|nr:DUF1292 domain-containing protein [Massilibacterium senegalense]
MALEIGDQIIIPFEEEEHLFEVYYMFKPDNYDHSYILVFPAGENMEEEVEVFAFRYYEEDDTDDAKDLPIAPLETDEEWDMVEEVLETLETLDEE